MTVGTHLIKIKGTFDKKIWGYEDEWVNEIFKEYIKTKIKNEIDSHYNPNLEFVRIDDNKIAVWIYIKALSINISRDIIIIYSDKFKIWIIMTIYFIFDLCFYIFFKYFIDPFIFVSPYFFIECTFYFY